MREIKFRAWDGKGIIDHERCVENKYSPTWKTNLTWMQYTGLKDKNGKEIYEGDLMYFGDVKRSDGKPFVIEFSTDLYGEQYGGGTDWFSGFSFPSQADKGEVIGNIYENPELLPSA